jgi:hypothetical protein
MPLSQVRSIYLILGLVLGCSGRLSEALAEQPGGPQGFEACRTIADDQARLECLKRLVAPPEPAAPSVELTSDPWPLIITRRPAGGRDAIAIMRTADTGRSDPDLAGLMIRCAEKTGFEVLLAVVRPFPPRTRRDIIVGTGAAQTRLHARVSSQGTGFILPVEATAFTNGLWQDLRELVVAIEDPESRIKGVIRLDGLGPAMSKLSASCPQN